MLIRNIIAPAELAELASDKKNNRVGRAVCVQALARFDAAGHIELFQKIVADDAGDDNITILREAVIALGVTRSPQAARPLREILRKPNIPSEIKGYAARALAAGLNATVALPDIEEAFEELKTYEQITVKLFVQALLHFGEQSSMKFLKTLESAPPDIRHYAAEALGTFAGEGKNESEAIEKLEETTGERFGFHDEQSHLVRGLLKNPRNNLLEMLSEHLEKERLTENSRWQLSSFLQKLVKDAALDQHLVVKIASHLVCDANAALRYNVLSTLGFLAIKFCRELYANLKSRDSSADEWTRACIVESLGYWDSDESDLLEARFDRDVLVRRAADLALKHQETRKRLKFHLEQFEHGTGLARLSSFICLLENEDMETVRHLAQKPASLV